jgi:HSP20 family protein
VDPRGRAAGRQERRHRRRGARNELQITGETVEKERVGILRRRTRRVGRFEYRVTLPGPIDPDSIDASLHDGILRVTVPKPEQARPRRVEIQTHSDNGAPAGPAATT